MGVNDLQTDTKNMAVCLVIVLLCFLSSCTSNSTSPKDEVSVTLEKPGLGAPGLDVALPLMVIDHLVTPNIKEKYKSYMDIYNDVNQHFYYKMSNVEIRRRKLLNSPEPIADASVYLRDHIEELQNGAGVEADLYNKVEDLVKATIQVIYSEETLDDEYEDKLELMRQEAISSISSGLLNHLSYGIAGVVSYVQSQIPGFYNRFKHMSSILPLPDHTEHLMPLLQLSMLSDSTLMQDNYTPHEARQVVEMLIRHRGAYRYFCEPGFEEMVEDLKEADFPVRENAQYDDDGNSYLAWARTYHSALKAVIEKGWEPEDSAEEGSLEALFAKVRDDPNLLQVSDTKLEQFMSVPMMVRILGQQPSD